MRSRKTIHNHREQKQTIQKQSQHSDKMFGYSDVTPMAQETPLEINVFLFIEIAR